MLRAWYGFAIKFRYTATFIKFLSSITVKIRYCIQFKCSVVLRKNSKIAAFRDYGFADILISLSIHTQTVMFSFQHPTFKSMTGVRRQQILVPGQPSKVLSSSIFKNPCGHLLVSTGSKQAVQSVSPTTSLPEPHLPATSSSARLRGKGMGH